MNYTTNYHLPQWVESDRIMMEDFNQMCEDIDGGIAAAKAAADSVQDAYTPANKPYVVGTYTGDGTRTNRTITLGFQPSFLIISSMTRGNNYETTTLLRFGIMGPSNISAEIARLESTGFTVFNSGYAEPKLNEEGRVYGYIAFR